MLIKMLHKKGKPMSGNQSRLKTEFERALAAVEDTWDKSNWTDKTFYANWLAQTYHYVLHSTRLLALGAANFPLDQNKFHFRFIEHLREERGHEKLALNDLEALGFELKDFPEMPALSAFYQTQYYWIERVSPLSFFGWILCLEGLAVRKGTGLYQKLDKNFGPKATGFLKIHQGEDVDHLEKAFEYLSSLTGEQADVVVANLKLSCGLYRILLEEIGTTAQSSFRRGKAA